jgi:hypothetical protein
MMMDLALHGSKFSGCLLKRKVRIIVCMFLSDKSQYIGIGQPLGQELHLPQWTQTSVRLRFLISEVFGVNLFR